jgi:hypothetical protein
MEKWKRIQSPKLNVPLELREIPSDKKGDRVWEVQELRSGAVFKVVLGEAAWRERRGRGPARVPSDSEAVHAVCLAVEESILTPPDKEPGMTYEISVSTEELAEATATTS